MSYSAAGFLKKTKKRRILVISAGGIDGGIQCLYFSVTGDTWEIIAHTSNPYPQRIAHTINALSNVNPPGITLPDLAQLDSTMTTLFTEIARTTLSRLPTAQRKPHAILLVKPYLWKGKIDETQENVIWNLTFGDAQHCASTLNTPVLTDFIRHHNLTGGEGRLPTSNGNLRIAAMTGGIVVFVNIGLVARITIVDTHGASVVTDSDSGPGTCCINTLMRRHQNKGSESFDRDGTLASEGSVDGECLEKMAGNEWFYLPSPKTAVPAQFDFLLDDPAFMSLKISDQFATVTALTARTVYNFFRSECPSEDTNITVFISGGGSHNQTLHNYLQTYFDTIPVRSIEELGIPADMRIPLAFGLTINAWLRGETIEWKNDSQSPLTAPGKWVLP